MFGTRFRKKLQYFMDYYFLKAAAVCFGIFVVALFLVHYFRPEPEIMLYAAVYDLTLDAAQKDALCRELDAACGEGTAASQILVDDSFRSDSRKDVERLQVLAANQAVDVIICPRKDIMMSYAAYGYLTDLTKVLPQEVVETAKGEDRLLVTPGMLWTDEISFEDHESGHGPALPYIYDLSGKKAWEALAGVGTACYLGVVLDSPHWVMAGELIAAMLA